MLMFIHSHHLSILQNIDGTKLMMVDKQPIDPLTLLNPPVPEGSSEGSSEGLAPDDSTPDGSVSDGSVSEGLAPDWDRNYKHDGILRDIDLALDILVIEAKPKDNYGEVGRGALRKPCQPVDNVPPSQSPQDESVRHPPLRVPGDTTGGTVLERWEKRAIYHDVPSVQRLDPTLL